MTMPPADTTLITELPDTPDTTAPPNSKGAAVETHGAGPAEPERSTSSAEKSHQAKFHFAESDRPYQPLNDKDLVELLQKWCAHPMFNVLPAPHPPLPCTREDSSCPCASHQPPTHSLVQSHAALCCCRHPVSPGLSGCSSHPSLLEVVAV